MNPLSGAEHLRRMQWHAFKWLGAHELLAEDYWDGGRGARWVLGTRGTFLHRCEIFAGTGGSLIVHGDFDVVRFGHYGDHADAFSRLCWLGLCYDVGYYVVQKASIGMGRWKPVRDYDADVACFDLQQLIADYKREDYRTELIDLLEEAQAHTASARDLWDFLSDNGGHDLYEHTFGQVLDAHVVVSHVALNRTACLLIEKYGMNGPALCAAARDAGPRPTTSSSIQV